LNGNELRWNPVYGLYNAPANGATVLWPPGTYALGAEIVNGINLDRAFWLHPSFAGSHQNRTNLTIEATGVTVVITDPEIQIFDLTGCDGLIVRGLTVKYEPFPFIQSAIVAIDLVNHTFDVAVDPGYLTFADTRFKYGPGLNFDGTCSYPSCQPPTYFCYGIPIDPATNLMRSGTGPYHFMLIDGYASLPGPLWRLTVNSQFWNYLAQFHVGDKFLYLLRRSRNIFSIADCGATATRQTPVLIENCSLHASAGSSLVLYNTPTTTGVQGAIVRNCTVTPDVGRVISTNGGGFLFLDCRSGPLMENCLVEGGMDDAWCLGTSRRLFQGYYQGDVSKIDLGPGPSLAAGDWLQVFDPQTGLVVYTTIAQIITGGPLGPRDWQRLQLTAPAPGMVVGTSPHTTTQIFNMNAAAPFATVRKNVVRNIRGGGVMSAVGGVMEGNTIEGAALAGLVVGNPYANGGQGPVPYGVTVRNNVVRNSGYVWSGHSLSGNGAAIAVGTSNWASEPASSASTDNIVLQGNRIESWATTGIYCCATKNVVISDAAGVPHVFAGAIDYYARAAIIAAPAEAIGIGTMDATLVTGAEYAIRIEYGVLSSVGMTGTILVTPPVEKLEDLR